MAIISMKTNCMPKNSLAAFCRRLMVAMTGAPQCGHAFAWSLNLVVAALVRARLICPGEELAADSRPQPRRVCQQLFRHAASVRWKFNSVNFRFRG